MSTNHIRIAETVTRVEMFDVSTNCKLVEWLSTVPYEDERRRISSLVADGTGQWLLESLELQKWPAQKIVELLRGFAVLDQHANDLRLTHVSIIHYFESLFLV